VQRRDGHIIVALEKYNFVVLARDRGAKGATNVPVGGLLVAIQVLHDVLCFIVTHGCFLWDELKETMEGFSSGLEINFWTST
jgi:hypothetical protein